MSFTDIKDIELPSVLTLQQSTTTKESELVEKTLAKMLRRLMAIVGKDPNFPGNVEALKQSYGLRVYSLLRKALQEQYIIGMNYVEKSFGIETFISGKDEFNLSRATDAAVEAFWFKVQVASQNIMQVQFEEAFGQEEILPFNLNYLWLLLSVSLSTMTLAQSTISKTVELVEANNIDTRRVQFKWIAQLDEKTCLVLPNGRPGCRILNGTVWEFGQIAEIPTPGGRGLSPTHYNCRCRIVVILDNKEKLL